MIPVGFGDGASMPFFSEHVGYFWLYGVLVIPLVMLVLPKRWFAVPPRLDDERKDSAQVAQPVE